MSVRAGSTNSLAGGSVVSIQRVIKHPDYTEMARTADIAVAVLATPLGITNSINILYLPPQNNYIADGQVVKIVSWGFESVSHEQQIFMLLVFYVVDYLYLIINMYIHIDYYMI